MPWARSWTTTATNCSAAVLVGRLPPLEITRTAWDTDSLHCFRGSAAFTIIIKGQCGRAWEDCPALNLWFFAPFVDESHRTGLDCIGVGRRWLILTNASPGADHGQSPTKPKTTCLMIYVLINTRMSIFKQQRSDYNSSLSCSNGDCDSRWCRYVISTLAQVPVLYDITRITRLHHGAEHCFASITSVTPGTVSWCCSHARPQNYSAR